MKLTAALFQLIEKSIIAKGSLLICLIIVLQVLYRAAGNSISYAEELARLLFIWVCFMGFSHAVSHSQHIRITFFIDKMSPRVQRLFDLLTDIGFIGTCFIMMIASFQLSHRLFQLGQLSSALEISLGFFYVAAFLGFTLSLFHLLLKFKHKLQELKSH
ncbi:MAG: TRAP transporter small permease [Cellvibrionales bacterium]|nr:TRAP transporter small permease [Cellvibrionales bacterium]